MFFVVKKLFHTVKTHFVELLLLAFTLYSRLVGNDWDSGQHFHPDERFLTMVQLALKVPTSLNSYLDPAISTLSPYNQGYSFFVYGAFPLILNKIIAVFAQTDTYGLTTLQGRFLSGLVDCGTVLVLYHLTLSLFPKHTKRRVLALLVSASYALAVLPIQLAHFFAVDSFLTFCLTMTLLQHVRLVRSPSIKQFVVGAVFFALAIACKVNAVFMAPLLVPMVLIPLWQHFRSKQLIITGLKFLGAGLVYAIIVTFVLHLTTPHYFANAFVLNPIPSTQFINNIKSLKQYEGPDVWFPPAIQWLSKPKVWFSVKNIVLYGYGIGLSTLAVIGLFSLAAESKNRKQMVEQWMLYGVVIWGLAVTLYQSLQFVQAIRYFIIVYPIFAILSGLGWLRLLQVFSNKKHQAIANSVIVVLLLIWPLAFLGVYHQKHSRVAASEWMHQTVPNHSLIGYEYWDDPLPIGVPGSTKQFVGESLHVFERDDFEKWRILNAQLNQLDYYVLSSNRAWGSITAIPRKYPRMAPYYQDLFAGKTDFELVAEFTNYPSLRYLGIPIDFPTDDADESFTVYDHPKVMIFMNKHTNRPPEVTGYDRANTK